MAIDFSEGAENRVDAAIATPLEAGDVLFDTIDIGASTPADVRSVTEADLGRFVHKTGRTTAHTQGFIQGLSGTVTGVRLENDAVVLSLGTVDLRLDEVLGIRTPPSAGPDDTNGDG